jgi:hypothetical protein
MGSTGHIDAVTFYLFWIGSAVALLALTGLRPSRRRSSMMAVLAAFLVGSSIFAPTLYFIGPVSPHAAQIQEWFEDYPRLAYVALALTIVALLGLLVIWAFGPRRRPPEPRT